MPTIAPTIMMPHMAGNIAAKYFEDAIGVLNAPRTMTTFADASDLVGKAQVFMSEHADKLGAAGTTAIQQADEGVGILRRLNLGSVNDVVPAEEIAKITTSFDNAAATLRGLGTVVEETGPAATHGGLQAAMPVLLVVGGIALAAYAVHLISKDK